jgi:hypothetical protein
MAPIRRNQSADSRGVEYSTPTLIYAVSHAAGTHAAKHPM